MLDHTFRLRTAGVHADVVDDQAIVISFASGNYYTIDGTGAFIIKAMTLAPVRAQDVLDALNQTYAPIGAPERTLQLGVFFGELLREELVEGVAYTGPKPGIVFHGPYGFQPIQKESRLADILTLDPIHEVTASGWPEAKNK